MAYGPCDSRWSCPIVIVICFDRVPVFQISDLTSSIHTRPFY